MATVPQLKPFNHAETQRKVRHPLQLLRKYIRRYIILEGVALTLLVASLLFWVGLAFDFGLYKFDIDAINIHGIDWLLELNDVDISGNSSLGIRVVLLGAIVVGLLYLGITRVALRWFREFNDNALALVLERRFPKELGDRLITAVELADPSLSKKYGYSQSMVEKTIVEACHTLERLPVSGVFNWGRLVKLWSLLAVSTLGIMVVTMAAFCGGSLFAAEKPLTPIAFGWKFYDASSIWTERNVLMMNTYWPRRAYLEVGRFQPSKDDATTMNVARDDARPDLQVRAYEWVIADRDRDKAPHGWRALTMHDLLTLTPALTKEVAIPVDFAYWQLEPEELEPNLGAALFDTATHERSSGDLAKHFATTNIKKKIDERAAGPALAEWLNWQKWKVDKLVQQMNDTKVRTHLRALRDGADYAALEKIIERLDELAEAPSMSRTLRKLDIPNEIDVSFRGDGSTFTDAKAVEAGNKYTISLGRLKDSTRFKFRARGDDYFTQPKTVALVAAPTPKRINIDKDEPAYIFHRLHGVDQMPLRGEKHVTRAQALSTTGDSNTIEVPLGSNVVVHVETDRKLRPDPAVFIKDSVVLPDGFDHYRGAPPAVNAEHSGFSLLMNNVTRKHEFSVEFFDQDNIRGKRRFKVLAMIDQEPQLGNLHVFGLNLRKPKFKLPERTKDNDAPFTRDLTEIANAYLITPDAMIPFECPVRDDYGLVRVGYSFQHRVEEFDIFAQSASKKAASPDAEQVQRRLGLAASNFQFWPGNPQSWMFGPAFLAWTARRVEQDLHQTQKFTDGYASAEGFQRLLKRKEELMTGANEFKKKLSEKRNATSWEFDFKDDWTENARGERDLGFDLRVHLRGLKTVDLKEFGQTHYLLRVSVQATDNNVETGAQYAVEEGKQTLHLRGNTKRNKNGYVNFLIVSENQLLSQIALEEELWFEKLEAVKEKVDAGIVSLSEQQNKIVRDPKADMENVLNRMNEIRTALNDTGNKLREAHQAYRNILEELRINRVRSDRKDKIYDTIYQPLENIVFDNPLFAGTGSFPKADEAFSEAYKLVESDVSAAKQSDATLHRKNMAAADKAMVTLSKEINHVLDAMSEGIVEARLIAILASIEDRQRKNSRFLEDMYREQVERLIREQLGLDDKKEPKKEEKKKAEKKISQHGAWPSLSVSQRSFRTSFPHGEKVEHSLRECVVSELGLVYLDNSGFQRTRGASALLFRPALPTLEIRRQYATLAHEPPTRYMKLLM